MVSSSTSHKSRLRLHFHTPSGRFRVSRGIRSAINQGLLLVECPEAIDAYRPGDAVSLDASAGRITVGARSFSFPSLPTEILAIRDAGGLLPYARAS